MHEEVQLIVESADELMDKAVGHLESELVKIRAGKANPVMLQGLAIEYYGVMTPINQVASVSAPDPRTIMVQPFDKKSLQAIERAIIEANLGFNPQNDGTIIRVPIPQLNEERRKQLVKQAKGEGEHAKVSVRNIRRDHNDQLKKLKNDGVSEDMIKNGEGEIQKLTDKHTEKIDEVLKKKESEIMTI